MLQQSLRAQILVLLGGSLAALLLIALACFGSLTGDVRAYRELLGGPVRAAQLIDEANLQFRARSRNGRTSCCADARQRPRRNTGASSKPRSERCRTSSGAWAAWPKAS